MGMVVRLEPLDAAIDAVLNCVLRTRAPLSAVDSPPGAGKTGLVERLAGLATLSFGQAVLCVTPRASQAEELASRLATAYPQMSVQLLMSASRSLSPALNPRVSVVNSARQLRQGGVVVSTVAKPSMHLDDLPAGAFDLLICDEAYQVSLYQLLPIMDVANVVIMVGDPGQLLPFEEIDLTRYQTAPGRVHSPAPIELLRKHPGIPRFLLPKTRRLVQDTVDIVQPAFYPALPFSSAVSASTRRLRFGAAGMAGIANTALDAVAAGASIISIVLPEQQQIVDGVDVELATLMAEVADQSLARAAEWEGVRPLSEEDIGCIDSHVASGGNVRSNLRARGRDLVRVDTPEIWQGAECPLTIIKHPLSGVLTPSEFDLDPGRYCVMLSRHQVGCIIVARENVTQAIGGYRHDCGKTVSGAEDRSWNGYNAHRIVWDELNTRGRLLRR
jgi:AAA domain